jgi:pimeloyl-ACP methyl ester carboxylesterase
MVSAGRKVMRGHTSNALAADLRACNTYQNGKQAASKVAGPVQVIVAGKDRMASRKATDELIANLRDPQVTLIAESGHIVQQEAPDKCRSLLKGFIFSNNPAM